MCFYAYYHLFSPFPRLLFWANLSTHRGLHDPSTDCWVCYETNCNSEPGFPSHLAAKMNCCWLNDHWFSWKQSCTNSNSQLCHRLWGFVAWALRHLAEIFTQSRIALTEALRSHLESRLSDSMGWPSSLWTAHVPLVLQLGLFSALFIYLSMCCWCFYLILDIPVTATWKLQGGMAVTDRVKVKAGRMGWGKRLCCGKATHFSWVQWWAMPGAWLHCFFWVLQLCCGKWQCSATQFAFSTCGRKQGFL